MQADIHNRAFRALLVAVIVATVLALSLCDAEHGGADAKDIEEERLGIIIQGNLIENKVKHLTVAFDFYVMKGILMQILSKLGFEMGRITLKENDLDTVHFHPYQSAVLYLGNLQKYLKFCLHSKIV